MDITEGYVILTGEFDVENGQIVSYCPQLGVASCGETVEEAFDNLGDALEVHLNALDEIGERDKVFKERKIEISRGPLPPDLVNVSVPPEKTFRVYRRRVSLAEVA